MDLGNNFRRTLKRHSLTIPTLIIIGLLMYGYFNYILPTNEKKEDEKNIDILKGIEEQLVGSIEDQIKTVDKDEFKVLLKEQGKDKINLNQYYIDSISVVSIANKLSDNKISLYKTIELKQINDSLNLNESVKVEDNIKIDVSKFLERIANNKNFNAILIYEVSDIAGAPSKTNTLLLSKNVNLSDQDSLIAKSRKNGPFSFTHSKNRYYSDQLRIPNTDIKLFLAIGVSQSQFDKNVRIIEPNILILCSILVIVLTLGISLTKPIISSYRERLSQLDLLRAITSIGILLTVLIVASMIFFWNSTLQIKNQNDLKLLADSIDTQFSRQLNSYKTLYPKVKLTKVEDIKDDSFRGKKINELLRVDSTLTLSKAESDFLPDLESFSKRNSKGVMIVIIKPDYYSITRKYRDRPYFKMLQYPDTMRGLTTIFARQDAEFQWIYSEKGEIGNSDAKIKSKEKPEGISCIAFKESFSSNLKMPPGTTYLIVDRKGNIMNMENNFHQNILLGTESCPELLQLLAGLDPSAFEMDYNGKRYQVYGRKLSGIKIDNPIYVLAIRDLTHLNRLSLFTFTNGILLTVLFTLFTLLTTYFYSNLFYHGYIDLTSNQHFHHLFPDNSHTNEYRLLLMLFSISIFFILILSLVVTPSTAIISYFILSANLTLVNSVLLNIRTYRPEKELLRLLVLLFIVSVCIPMIFIYHNLFLLAFLAVFVTHIPIIYYYKRWRQREKLNIEDFAKEKNKGSNRKIYTYFMTARAAFIFIVFPIVLINAYYVTEINDFVNYNYSALKSSKSPEANTESSNKAIMINAYNYKTGPSLQPITFPTRNRQEIRIIEKANLGILDRPILFEIPKFVFKNSDYSYNYYVGVDTLWDYQYYYLLLLIIVFLIYLGNRLMNFYGNHFFYYDLMQASYEGYFPCNKSEMTNDHLFITMVTDSEIKQLKQTKRNTTANNKASCTDRGTDIDHVFEKDNNGEISPFLRMAFMLNYNHKTFDDEYKALWTDLPSDLQFVLFDFSKDHFINYKNKYLLMELMELGLVNSDKLTGRLKIMSLSFRLYILSQYNRDEKFMETLETAKENETFSKIKITILIVAVSAIILLLYLNEDSYSRVTAVGTGLGSLLAIVEKFFNFTKNT